MKTNQTKYTYQDDATHSAWDVRQLFQNITDHVWILGLCLLAAIGLATGYLLIKKTTYASTAVLYVEQMDQKVVTIQDVSQQDLESSDTMKTVEQSLTTDDLLLRVIKDNHLADNVDFLPTKKRGYTDDELIKALSQRLKVKVRRGTRLIDVTAKSYSAVLSQQIVTSLITEYQGQVLGQRLAAANSANDFLLKEVENFKGNLEKSESQLEAYREQNNAVSLEEKQNIVVDTLKDLNVKLNDARSQRLTLEADLASYQQAAGNPQKIRLIASVAGDRAVLDAQNRVSDMEQTIAGLAQHYRPEHPKFIDAQSQLHQLKSDLDQAILMSGAQIPIAYQSAQVNEQKLAQALKEQEQIAMQLDKIAIPYNVLVRNVEVNLSLYQSLVTRLKETDITRSLGLTQVRVLTAPRITTEPAGPKTAIILALCLFAGLFGGIGLCVFASSLDPSMRSVDEVEEALELKVLASIPQARDAKKGRPLPALSQPDSAAAEAFRSLRTGLELKSGGNRQVILFTSACASEGKSFCSVNTAVALARQGYRTLIIDADLRLPNLWKTFSLAPDLPGLVDCLAGTKKAGQVIVETKIANLFALTAGSFVANSTELMSAGRLTQLLQDATFGSFDRIIFDTAPVNAVSDALHLVKHSTAVCLVVQAGRTPVKAAQRAEAALLQANAGNIGVVLNRVAASRYNPYGYNLWKLSMPHAGVNITTASR
jgi:capsular exopolysaccharide synthesis family protein